MASLAASCAWCASVAATVSCTECEAEMLLCRACDIAVHRHHLRKQHVRSAIGGGAPTSSSSSHPDASKNKKRRASGAPGSDAAVADASASASTLSSSLSAPGASAGASANAASVSTAASDESAAPVSRAMNHVRISRIELAPMGVFESCWVEKYGAPRQGALVAESRGVIHLTCFKGARHSALDGLEAFSHLIVLFLFHDNRDRRTELIPDAQSASSGNVDTPHTIRYTSEGAAKVQPPRLTMASKHKLGVFATRTPHRPAPIGLTVCRIVEVQHALGRVVVSGVDIIDKTPIVDIKPYVPRYDAFPNAQTPAWITPAASATADTDVKLGEEAPASAASTNSSTASVSVEFSAEADADLLRLAPKLRLFRNAPAAARACILATLGEDIRSKHEKHRGNGSYGFCLDVLNIKFDVEVDAQQHIAVRVQALEHWPENFEHVRSKPHH